VTRSIYLAGLALLAGCTSLSDVCTLIGCNSGLTVSLAQAPVGGYTIEVFAQAGGPHFTFECASAAQCGTAAEFKDFTPDQATIRVTTAAGTREQTVQPTYSQNQPNGPSCGPTCRQASVTVALPG
jgi:hypothetical protein